MKIQFHRQFRKQYKKLPKQSRKQVNDALEIFRKNPFDPSLENHPLSGTMKGQRAISAGFDLRIIFQEKDGYAVVLMIAVGTHEQVY